MRPDEFKVITGNNTAECGVTAAARVAMITRPAASNEFRWQRLLVSIAQPKLNANEFRTTCRVSGVLQLAQNIYGGGPLRPYLEEQDVLLCRIKDFIRKSSSTTTASNLFIGWGICATPGRSQIQPRGRPHASVDGSGNPLLGLSALSNFHSVGRRSGYTSVPIPMAPAEEETVAAQRVQRRRRTEHCRCHLQCPQRASKARPDH